MKTVPFRIVLSFEALISPEEAKGEEKLAADSVSMASALQDLLAGNTSSPTVKVISVTVDGQEIPLP